MDVPRIGVTVQRGPTMDGIGRYVADVVPESEAEPVDVVAALEAADVDVLVSYLPVGSEDATRWYAERAIEAGVAFVNAIPVFIGREPEWQAKFAAAGVGLRAGAGVLPRRRGAGAQPLRSGLRLPWPGRPGDTRHRRRRLLSQDHSGSKPIRNISRAPR